MDCDEIIVSKEVITLAGMFDNLDGHMKLELVGILLEKMENEEIELNGTIVTPEEVGIDDAFASCAIILEMITRE